MSKQAAIDGDSFLLDLTNEMLLAKDRHDLAGIIQQTLKECFLAVGYLIHLPGEMPLFYENAFPEVQKNQWGDFITDFIRERHTGMEETNSVQSFSLNSTESRSRGAKHLRINKAISSPLALKNKTIGVLFLFFDRERALTKNHLQLLRRISFQIALALSRGLVGQAAIAPLTQEQTERQLEEIKLYKQQLEEEKLYLQQEVSGIYAFNEIIGTSPEMKAVYEQMSQVAFANSTVLILGETGTGKELIARGIHGTSRRKDKLMIKVNCASIPENLIESELFGHERGAFTGAFERRIGKFELANNGTLFLDEIGEMPLELQVKLLRAIQEKEIERIGGKSVIKVDVRIIAATNRDLLKEVQDGNFRSDLFYRLNVFPITLPPLRNRKDDIPLLAGHFINRLARNTGKKAIRLSSNAMKDLMAYDWPGNVRELEHLLERSILMSKTELIREVNLLNASHTSSEPEAAETLIKTSLENERDHLLFVLRKCNGKIYGRGGAAELLDMHVSTLNSRIRKLGIRKEQIFVVQPQM